MPMSKARITASWLVELLEDAGYVVGKGDGTPWKEAQGTGIYFMPVPDRANLDEVARILAEAAKKAGVVFDREADNE